MKNSLVYVAVSLLLVSMSFKFSYVDGELSAIWFWAESIQVPVILVSSALILLGYHFYSKNLPSRR